MTRDWPAMVADAASRGSGQRRRPRQLEPGRMDPGRSSDDTVSRFATSQVVLKLSADHTHGRGYGGHLADAHARAIGSGYSSESAASARRRQSAANSGFVSA